MWSPKIPPPFFSNKSLNTIKKCMARTFLCSKQGVQQHGCSKKWENRKLRIEKIGKIGNFVLKNRRKIGKSIVVSLTKIASLHPIKATIKATNPHLLCLLDLDQLSRLRRSENDQ